VEDPLVLRGHRCRAGQPWRQRQRRRSLATGVEILGRGDLLGIYPEGTRSPDGRLYRGKTGPVRMALEAGVRIVPCAVIGTDQAMPTGTYVPNRSPVTVRYGQPLDLSRFADRRRTRSSCARPPTS
jgi:1-acyl-sn-glycerol-3-phosphate acyltransferase